MNDAIRKIFTANLGIKKNEKALVFTDLIRGNESITEEDRVRRTSLREIAMNAAKAGKVCCDTIYMEFPATAGHGCEPPAALWKAAFGTDTAEALEDAGLLEKLLTKTASHGDIKAAEELIKKYALASRNFDAIVALSNFSTSHTRFRDFLTRLRGVRYASMPLFEDFMLNGAMTADWNEVEKRTLRLKERMYGGEMVYITSRNGTSICFSIKGRELIADTGILTKPGSFGNLPAGEGFLAPVEGTAVGTLVLEWGPTGKLRESVELEIKDGRAVKVDGGSALAHALREKIKANPLFGNIAELGIGTNDKATRPDNILETEKILGTVHIALGDNSSFGGKVSVPFHQDFIFFRPTMEVVKGEEKVEIIIDGEPRF